MKRLVRSHFSIYIYLSKARGRSQAWNPSLESKEGINPTPSPEVYSCKSFPCSHYLDINFYLNSRALYGAYEFMAYNFLHCGVVRENFDPRLSFIILSVDSNALCVLNPYFASRRSTHNKSSLVL